MLGSGRDQFLGRWHGQKNHPIRQVEPFDDRQRIGILVLQTNQQDRARNQVITELRDGPVRRVVAQVAANQTLQHAGIEQKNSFRRPEYALPPAGVRAVERLVLSMRETTMRQASYCF